MVFILEYGDFSMHLALVIMIAAVIISMGFAIPSYAVNSEWPRCQHFTAYHEDGLVYGEWWVGDCSNSNTDRVGKYIQDFR